MEGGLGEAPAAPAPGMTFAALPFPVRSFAGLGVCRYLVYKEPGRFIAVEAETAAEAIKKSGIDEPLRIKRDVPGQETLLDRRRVLE